MVARPGGEAWRGVALAWWAAMAWDLEGQGKEREEEKTHMEGKRHMARTRLVGGFVFFLPKHFIKRCIAKIFNNNHAFRIIVCVKLRN